MLLVLIVFPLTFVDSYKGPWLVKGGEQANRAEVTLERGFKLWRESANDPSKLYELEGYLQGMWKSPEEWSRAILLELFPPCMNVWCGECYVAHPQDPFPVQGPPEEEEGIVETTPDEKAFKQGRNGDHLMGIPFECDLCHFRNITKRDPELTSRGDGHTLMVIRRANLDACWSRATRTVRSNLNRIVTDTESADFAFELYEYLPQLGWPKVEDRVGMALALVTLNASLRTGKYA